MKKKMYEQAITDFNRAIEIDKNFTAAYYRRGNVYYMQKVYDKAIADYNKALLCEKLKKIREAIKAYGDFLTYADG